MRLIDKHRLSILEKLRQMSLYRHDKKLTRHGISLFPARKREPGASQFFLELSNFALFHHNLKFIYKSQRFKFSNSSNECSFCSLFPTSNIIPAETFTHIFLTCKHTTELSQKYFTNLTSLDVTFPSLLTQGSQIEAKYNIILNIETTLFCFFIHHCLRNSKIPTFISFLQFTFELKKNMLQNSNKYSILYSKFCKKYGQQINYYNKWLSLI